MANGSQAGKSTLAIIFTDLIDDADEVEEHLAEALWWHMAASAAAVTARSRGGSAPGKSGNVERNFEGTHRHYMLKYFWPHTQVRPNTSSYSPRVSEKIFERRFRMPRSVFNRVFEGVVRSSPYMRKGLTPDATGKLGISPLMKVIAALKQLAYGIPADLCDDMFGISESTASQCMLDFCKHVIAVFGATYLREPTGDDLKAIERRFRATGLPGCIGCVDCAGWFWKNAPKRRQGSLIGKDGNPCLRMEVICDLDLWVWSFQFGFPGMFNDLNILSASNHFRNILAGNFPTVMPTYKIHGEIFCWYYYLADGIYPKWKIFLQSIRETTTEKQSRFAKVQEGVRKSVERVFGVWCSGDSKSCLSSPNYGRRKK
jgi:Plant transposon protein